MPVIESIRRTGVKSLREIAAELEARGIRTPRGGTTWTAMAVKRILDRRAAGGAPVHQLGREVAPRRAGPREPEHGLEEAAVVEGGTPGPGLLGRQ
jgi:hypothetical protein